MSIRQLAELGSESGKIITRLQLTREIVYMAMSVLRNERAAQVTLMSILGATRFKTFFHGVLVPTRCPRLLRHRACGLEDSYVHLLQCYRIQRLERKGAEPLDFLVEMARRAAPARPGTVRPMFVEREARTTGGEARGGQA